MVNGLIGSTVVGFKYDKGIILVTDTAASYGYLGVEGITKVFKITNNCAIAFSGMIGDIQYLKNFISEEIANDPMPIDPQGIHKLIQRVIYSRRSRMELLNLSVVICGVNKKQECLLESTDEKGRFLGVVNSKGNFWFDDSVATGIASHLILPILRDKNHKVMNKQDAMILAEECMRLLVYKDIRASRNIQMAVCEENNVEILKPKDIATNWEIGLLKDEIVLE